MTASRLSPASEVFSDLAAKKNLPGSLTNRVQAAKTLLKDLFDSLKHNAIEVKEDPNVEHSLHIKFGTLTLVANVDEATGKFFLYTPSKGGPVEVPLRFNRSVWKLTGGERFVTADGAVRWESGLDVLAERIRTLVDP